MPSCRSALKWGFLFSYASLPIAAAHWPDFRMEGLDGLLWGGSFLSLITGNCTMRDNTTIAAQWVRLAYHDMSTHDVGDGSGGLDASIAFELDRAQNIGIGMAGSVSDFLGFTSPSVSLADVIAVGTVLGVASCGGPLIPLRGGRVDATTPGPATVPEPQEDLASHTESFKRQGFSQSEMIALVACGHSLGGVRTEDFPDIIHAPVDGNVALFDGTQGFDHTVVSGYLDGTTPNPLVIGPNSTTNSDLRIFSSDGNATMQSLASPENFNKVCADLFERMIDTVPRGVQLTEVVEPMQYKVGQTTLFPGNDGMLRLTTGIRVVGLHSSRCVTLFWNDRQGSVCSTAGCSASPSSTFESVGTFMAVRRGIDGYTTYTFDTKVNVTSSISKFWFKIEEGDGSEAVLVDNDGAGLVINQDTVLFDRARSAFVTEGTTFHLNLVVAVRTSDPTTKVSALTYAIGTEAQPTPKRETVELSPDSRFPPVVGYTFFSGNFPNSLQWVDIAAEVEGGVVRETNIQVSILRE
ncbi:hypothetical protein V5O48_006209 [Marasmius crinis-equi]|uniref:Peroxidase n=1 Tax=Marasmius crinis-equi TaxID=585013 RepID=A0ABR3FK42_9AGAR